MFAGQACTSSPQSDRRWSLVTLLGVRALLVGAALVWPYLKYSDAEERTAARHLDKVRVTGFEYRGEDYANFQAVSRIWIQTGRPVDAAPAIQYDGRQLRRDYPNGPPRSRFEEELGWLRVDERLPCVLNAYQVREVRGSRVADLTSSERRAIERGAATLVRVVVVCGKG
ncbi:hypothetical protein GA0070613_1253 [Micromonospora inositola]|uniref:Uncharacterized protein n=1 Tax=Micromonospora inositola TaxID=47865 RepID=A0A1C5HF75_9ACTN|nr:hypothetical protein GA0070613_1253 [Micromonospora inositola]